MPLGMSQITPGGIPRFPPGFRPQGIPQLADISNILQEQTNPQILGGSLLDQPGEPLINAPAPLPSFTPPDFGPRPPGLPSIAPWPPTGIPSAPEPEPEPELLPEPEIAATIEPEILESAPSPIETYTGEPLDPYDPTIPLRPGTETQLLTNVNIDNWPERPTLNLPEFVPSAARFTPPAYISPELEALPEFAAPEYDPYGAGDVRGRTQRLIGPGIRSLESSVRRSLSGAFENPNVRRQRERASLAGFGMGLEDISTAATGQALSEYGVDFGREFETAQRGFTTRRQQTELSNLALTQGTQINYQRDLLTYTQERQRAQQVADINYQTQQQEAINNFLAEMQAYLQETGQTINIITEER